MVNLASYGITRIQLRITRCFLQLSRPNVSYVTPIFGEMMDLSHTIQFKKYIHIPTLEQCVMLRQCWLCASTAVTMLD